MYIGEVSKKTGFSRDTIRFYEKKGLIKVDPRDRYSNNYKRYSVTNVKRLLMIRKLKDYGFTLNEIKSLLEKKERGGLDCKNGKEKVKQKVSSIDEKITKLRNIRERLLQSIRECPENCKIQEKLDKIVQIQKFADE